MLLDLNKHSYFLVYVHSLKTTIAHHEEYNSQSLIAKSGSCCLCTIFFKGLKFPRLKRSKYPLEILKLWRETIDHPINRVIYRPAETQLVSVNNPVSISSHEEIENFFLWRQDLKGYPKRIKSNLRIYNFITN